MTNFFYLGYFLEMLLPIIGIVAFLDRHKNGIIKGIFCVVVGATVDVVNVYVQLACGRDDRLLITLPVDYLLLCLWFLIMWISVIFGIYFCVKVTLKEVIYLFAISYAIEHIFFCVRKLISYYSGGVIDEYNVVLYLVCIMSSFAMAYFWFAKATVINGKYHMETASAVWATVMIMLVVWGLSIWADLSDYMHIHAIYAILASLFMLINQRSQLIRENERREFQRKERIWKETQFRYQLSKDAMAVVNQHYHDMKHQINVLANMENDEKRRGILTEMENDIAVYDAVVRTGNTYLDTVLTEKKLICHSKEIQMSCIVDGQQLEFIDELDLYTFMGNALDNAIEANEKIIDSSKRWISVQIQNKKGIILIEIVNPYEGHLNSKGDLFETTKGDTVSHGFGLISIKNIVERYNGQLIIKTENNKFLIRIIFNN